MTDRLESMSILLAVVDAGSFSAASRQLAIPLATVSRKVGELESQLKTRLLLRSTRSLSLTEAGHAYVAACRRILDQVAEAERAATGEYTAPKGELVITAPIVFGRLHVVPVVAAFLQAYPDVDVRLMLSDQTMNLLDEHIDVAVRIGVLSDSDLIALRIGGIRPVVCASPSYFSVHGIPQTPAELSRHDCVTFDALTSARRWLFQHGKTEVPVPIHSRLIVNTAESAIDAVKAGVGITRVLCYQVAQEKRDATLQVVLESFEPTPWPVHLVHAGQGLLPLKLRAFLDFAAPRLEKRLI